MARATIPVNEIDPTHALYAEAKAQWREYGRVQIAGYTYKKIGEGTGLKFVREVYTGVVMGSYNGSSFPSTAVRENIPMSELNRQDTLDSSSEEEPEEVKPVVKKPVASKK